MRIGFLSHLDDNLWLFRLPIMRELLTRGNEVFAVAPRGKRWEAFAQEGIQPIDYAIARRSLNPLKERQAVGAIYRAIAPLKLDILHTFTAKPNIYGTFAGRRAKIPVIYNLVEGLGSYYVEEDLRSRIMRRMIERLYKKAFSLSDGCVFVNRDDPAYMIGRGIIDPAKVTIIRSVGVDTRLFSPDAVDTDAVARLRAELSPDGRPIVMMVARAIWHKGVAEFYEAAERLGQKAVFVLVGGTDTGNPSCADETFLRAGAVKWLGERDEMVTLTATADIYVLPTFYREGVPRTLLEAASMGKPLVATDVVGCREVVEDGMNGYLVPPRDGAKLAAAIDILLADPLKRQRFGVASRRKAVREFDVKQVVQHYMKLYESACVS